MRKQRLTGGRLLDFEAFSRNLRALTESRGMLGKDLAAELNITAATLSRYMTNSRVPDIEYVYRISRYFNVTMDFLLGLSNSKRSDFTLQGDRRIIIHIFCTVLCYPNSGGISGGISAEFPEWPIFFYIYIKKDIYKYIYGYGYG